MICAIGEGFVGIGLPNYQIKYNKSLLKITCVGPIGMEFGALYLADYWWDRRNDRKSWRRERKERKNIKEGD